MIAVARAAQECSFAQRESRPRVALENLGRYHKLFVDVVKHEGLEGLADRMKKARDRAKQK